MSNQALRLINSSNVPMNITKGRASTINGPINNAEVPTRLGLSQGSADIANSQLSDNLTAGPVNNTISPTNIASMPASNKTMMAEMSENTATAVKGLLSLQVGALVMALIIALPLIFRNFKTGRYRAGWFLARTKAASSNLGSMGIVAQSVNRASSVPIGQKTSAFEVEFRNIYNATLLKTIPWFKVTVGSFIFEQLFINCIALAFMYKNPEPFGNFKRPAWIAVALLPLQFLLALKNSPIALIGKGHERLNPIHRTLGVVITIFCLLHGFIWWRRKITTNAPVVFKGASFYGLVALVAFVVILLSSIKWIRARIYQTFLVCHIVGYSVALVALWHHVSALKPIVTFVASLIAVDAVISYLKTSVRSAVFTSLPSGMTMIEVDRIGEGWKAGQYVYLRVFNGVRSFEKHPFTIANAPASLSPSGRNTLFLMVKATGDFTNQMHRVGYAEAALIGDLEGNQVNFDEKSFHELNGATSDRRLAVAIEGPYGTSYLDMCDRETVILVAGGSGFTYCMSTFEHIVGNARKGLGITKKIKILWALRNIEMVRVFASPLNEALECAKQLRLEVIFHLYITTPIKHSDMNPVPAAQITPRRMDFKNVLFEALQSTCASIDSRGETRGCGVVVGVCGPEGLVISARQAVSSADRALARKSGGIQFHSELFQF